MDASRFLSCVAVGVFELGGENSRLLYEVYMGVWEQSRICWSTDKFVSIGTERVPCGAALEDGYMQGSGVRQSAPFKMWLKRLLYPILQFRNLLLVDGFVKWTVGKMIRRYVDDKTVFLEIGCGDAYLRRYLPKGVWYNGMDLQLSDFHLRAAFSRPGANIACASATSIPIADNTVTLFTSVETFEHIPHIDIAMNEIRRVATPGAILVCSIPNNYCYKYDKKGKNIQHINEWTYEGFIKFMRLHGFELLEGRMMGWWVPLPSWVTSLSCDIPYSSSNEYYNTSFVYVFRVCK